MADLERETAILDEEAIAKGDSTRDVTVNSPIVSIGATELKKRMEKKGRRARSLY